MATLYEIMADRPDMLEMLLSLSAGLLNAEMTAEDEQVAEEQAGDPTPVIQADEVPAPNASRSAEAPVGESEPLAAQAEALPVSRARSAPPAKVLPDVVHKVRQYTRGKRLLIVGGIAKETDRKRIEAALECRVDWRIARKGESMNGMYHAARKCDLLLSLIRLSSHSHSAGMTGLSRETGIPLVRVVRGHNPSSIAHDIAEQLLQKS